MMADLRGIAVNPVTNLVYVVDALGSDVSVIDGASDTRLSLVTVGNGPTFIALNPVTNKIYTANQIAGTVTVIDGSLNNTASTSTITVGMGPNSLAVNPTTNQIYVAANSNPLPIVEVRGRPRAATQAVSLGTLSVIDGAVNTTASTSTVSLGGGAIPVNVAVNPVTNQVYVSNQGSDTVAVFDGSTNRTATVTVGSSSQVNGTSINANPATNKIYVPNSFSNTVTVIDGSTNATTTISAGIGTDPNNLAINPVTNTIYVTNLADATVSVIDGSTDTVSAVVTVGFSSQVNRTSIALNPVTNKIYVPNSFSNTVTVIDGATNTTKTITSGIGSIPNNLAINAVTNKIYVTNLGDQTVSVIDGFSDTVSVVVNVGSSSQVNGSSIAVNPATNKIYVPNSFSNTVTVIDGSTNNTNTISTGIGTIPNNLAINPVTNTIYVTNLADATVSVIDGLSDTVVNVITVGSSSQANRTSIAVNPVTNKVYVPNSFSNTVTVIDGANLVTNTITPGTTPNAVAVNLATNNIYVTNLADATVTVISEEQPQPIPLTTAITPLPGNISTTATPTFTFTPETTFAPMAPPIRQVYFQMDTWEGAWTAATPKGGIYTGTVAQPLYLGTHVVYAFATDGQESTSTGLAQQLIGKIAPQVVTVVRPGSTTTISADINPAGVGQSVTFTSMVTGGVCTTPTGTVTFFDGANSLGSAVLVSGTASLSTSALTLGTHSITAVYSGDANFSGSSSEALTEVISASNPSPLLTSLSPNSAVAGDPAFTLTVTGSSFVAGSVVVWNGVTLVTTFVSATELTAAVPATLIANPGIFPVVVTSPGPGGGTSAPLFFAVATPTPVLTSLAPNTAAAGGPAFTMTLDGSGFISTSVARWNGTDLPTTFVSATQLTAAVPAGDIQTVGTASVAVFNPDPSPGIARTHARPLPHGPGPGPSGILSNALPFTITANVTPPVLTSLSPSAANAGGAAFTMTLTGSGFVSGAIARWNGVDLVTTFVSATQLTAAVPAGDIATAGTASVTVANPSPGGSSGALTFTVNASNPVPALTMLSPNTVAAGGPAFTLTLTGSNFLAGSVAQWNGVALTTTFVSATQLTAPVPASDLAAGAVVSVTVLNPAPGGGTSAVLSLTITDFATTSPTPPQTVTAGQSATFTIATAPVLGPFPNQVTLSATGLPPGGAASFNPSSVAAGSTSTMIVTTTARGSHAMTQNRPGPLPPGRPSFPAWPTLAFVGVALGLSWSAKLQVRSHRRLVPLAGLACIAVAAIYISGCAEGFPRLPVNSGTPAGTYVITVTGTSGTLHHSTTVTLTVQ
jgi:YVTN family beta-propeller protein